MDEFSVLKNSSGVGRRLNDLHVSIFNLLQQWDNENQNCCELLERICQCRIQMMDRIKANRKADNEADLHRQMFITDVILRNSELLCTSIAKFDSFWLRLRKFGPKLAALHDLISSTSSDDTSASPDDAHQLLQFRAKELLDLFPIVLEMYEQELSFKRDSVVDLAVFDDKDLFTAIISAWKHGIYIEPAIVSLLYPF
ncbi:hypothetical protein niasHS_000538 [Heterodera schachtii]|uniref:Uncharacterized protein n=1 Tax=Heterodera schachtii TaxID=97005 RepID=A0ABD2K4K2_HETSC